MKKSTKVALGVAVAAGAGYLAGVLTAPKSGKETRQDIKNAAVKAKTEAEKRLKQANIELNKLIEQAKPILKNASDKTKAGFAEALKQAEAAKNKVREMISSIHEGDEADDKDLDNAIKEADKALKNLHNYIKKDAKKG